MSRRYFSLIIPLVLMASGFTLPQQTPQKVAQEAAESWLRLIDAGKYTESWDELAEVTKLRIPKESWEKLHKAASTTSDADAGQARKIIRSEVTSTLSIKDKAGVRLVYMAEPDAHRSITEIVELVQEEARGWRVAFYLKMANTFLFWPGSPISSGEKPQGDSMPTGDPKELPGPEPVRPGAGIGSGSSPAIEPGDRNNGTTVDERPVPLNVPKPRYTEEARRNRVEGVVIMRVLVGADGSVKQVKITHGLPDGLDEQAVEAAYQLRFKPAMKGGKPMEFWLSMSIEFNLK